MRMASMPYSPIPVKLYSSNVQQVMLTYSYTIRRQNLEGRLVFQVQEQLPSLQKINMKQCTNSNQHMRLYCSLLEKSYLGIRSAGRIVNTLIKGKVP